MVVTETEEMEQKPGIWPQDKAVEKSPEKIIEETVEEDARETVEETIEETVEEAVQETVDEEDAGKQEKEVKKQKFKKAKHQKIETQSSHFKKLSEWLLPYFIAVVLVVVVGSAILLISESKTRHLYGQLQEQYGEYFADEW